MNSHMKLQVCFIEDKSIDRFACFLSAVVDHKGDAGGVIINFSQENIQIIYSRVHENNEVDDYFFFRRDIHNYFEFTYYLIKDKTFTKRLFDNFPHMDDGKEFHTFRMDIEDFTSMEQIISSNITKYKNFFLKAKSKKENNRIDNVFRVRIEAHGNYIVHDFKLKTCRRYYRVTPALPPEETGFLTIKLNLKCLKEIAERFRTMAVFKKKDLSNFFLIKFCYQNNYKLDVCFMFNNKFQIRLRFIKDKIKFSQDFDFNKIFAVPLKNFISMISDYDPNNYNNVMFLTFVEPEISFRCYTSRCDNDDKILDEKQAYYSEYVMNMQAQIVQTIDQYNHLLCKMD